MFIAVDDTDSREGMCTTFLATELIREFKEYQLIDYPRLVRLNPNVPWKTRGNGAIVLEIGIGRKKKQRIGHIEKDIDLYNKEEEIKEDLLDRTKNIVERWARFDSDKTNPGIVIAKERPDRSIYEKAVRDIVSFEEIVDILDEGLYKYKGYRKKRGLIGATSALAWRPNDYTYEIIAYREKRRWGTKREIEENDVIRLDNTLESSFDNYDYEEESSAIDPNSPCPVLYGVRGDDPVELQNSLGIIKSEHVERWITFLTNQATDDHIQIKSIDNIKPWNSVKIKGTVVSSPKVIEGGHVFFDIEENEQRITAAAYEPTKGFREIIKKLIVGDKVELYGGIRKEPITINIEKIRIISLAKKEVKVGNPRCPKCGKRMSSVGKNAGFRCKRCSTKASEEDIELEIVERDLEERWYEPPVSARRHLAKPLTRMKKDIHHG
ncbi:MAG: TiaS agmantine-binding domain-containing protein [Thermoplasmatota archaeon]